MHETWRSFVESSEKIRRTQYHQKYLEFSQKYINGDKMNKSQKWINLENNGKFVKVIYGEIC